VAEADVVQRADHAMRGRLRDLAADRLAEQELAD
jgi:hypothetical protein